MSGSASKLLPLRIRLPYTTEEEFIDKYGSNVARGGVFVATRALKPEGTGLAFEFVLADGTRLLRGEGVVVKAQVDAGGGRAGMTVRFVKLDAASKALIDRVVTRRSGEAPPMAPARRVEAPAEARTPAPPPRTETAAPPPAQTPTPPEEGDDLDFDITASDTEPEPPQPAPPPAKPEPTSRAARPRAVTPASDTEVSSIMQSWLAEPSGNPEPPARAEPEPDDGTEPPTPAIGYTELNELLAAHAGTEASAEGLTSSAGTPPGEASANRAGSEAPWSTALTSGARPGAKELPSPTEASTARAEPGGSPSTAPAEAPATRPEPGGPPSTAPAARAEPGSPPSTARAEPEAAPAEAPTARSEPEAPEAEAARNRRRALLEVPVTTPAAAPTPPEVVLGIDVGTSHARVAVFHEGTVRLIPLPGDGTELPALVAVDGGDELLVGPAAQVEASRAPRRAASGLKRLLGLRARSPRLRGLASQLPFPITADSRGDAAVELGGRLVAPTLFTAMLLRELKHAAASYLGRKATRAVICAPTHFTERQRASLREAAMLAGLDAQRIVTSSAAAALAYGQGRGLARKRVLVVDLGGGGLEVCVVQVTGDDLEVITTGGDPTVGGMDFDARIAEALASELATQGIPKPEHALDWNPLRAAAESAKVALSGQEQTDVSLSSGTVPPLSRERMEALTADLAQRVTAVVREVLETNALSPQGLDAVLLLGGQGRAPLVRRRLEESLGVPVRDDVDPRGAVALGAALLGQALLLARDGKPAATISEVLSAPIGVAERAGTLHRVLERNTRLPASKTLTLSSTPGPLDVTLFQGPSPMATENEYLGRLRLIVERPGEVELHFALSADGALSLEATLPGGKRHAVSLATEDQDDAALAALISRSPLEGEPEARPGGLLSGLKKLFGRR